MVGGSMRHLYAVPTPNSEDFPCDARESRAGLRHELPELAAAR
jgi:hypothetical protein